MHLKNKKKAAMFVLGGDGCEVIGVKVHNNERSRPAGAPSATPPFLPWYYGWREE